MARRRGSDDASVSSHMFRMSTPERQRSRKSAAPLKKMPEIQWRPLDVAQTDLILKEMNEAKETFVKLREQCEQDESDNMRHQVVATRCDLTFLSCWG